MRENWESEVDLEDDVEEGESQDIIDDVEAEAYDLSAVDVKIVNDILKLATTNFEKKPAKWRGLLEGVKKILQANQKGEYEEEEFFTGDLNDKLVEANELVDQ